MFKLDDPSKNTGINDAGKHHQQYQEHLQSKHHKTNVASCSDCHSSHGGAKPLIVAKVTCKGCHDASCAVEKYMPGTGQTATGLFIRTHTLNKGQARPPALTASGNPVYQNPATKWRAAQYALRFACKTSPRPAEAGPTTAPPAPERCRARRSGPEFPHRGQFK